MQIGTPAPVGILTDLRIRGFKAIFDSQWITLKPLTVFIGRNGTGKSSVFEALQWLQTATRFGIQEATDVKFNDFSFLCNKRATAIRLEAHVTNRVRYDLEIGAGAQGRPIVFAESCQEGRTRGTKTTITTKKGKRGPPWRTILGGNPVRDGDDLALAHTNSTDARGAARLLTILRSAVFLRLSPTVIARPGPAKLPARGPYLDEEGRLLPALLSSLPPKAIAQLTGNLQEILPGVEGVRTVRAPDENEAIFSLEERMVARGGTRLFPLPSWMLSEGTRRVVAILALLETTPAPSLIAIEELENGLDPWTLRVVLDALKRASKKGVQVLITTHSPFLLDHVDATSVIEVDRKSGDSIFTPITQYPEAKRFQGQIPPGTMYVSGYFERRPRRP